MIIIWIERYLFVCGLDIVMIPNDEGDFKITTKEDLVHFCNVLIQRQQAH